VRLQRSMLNLVGSCARTSIANIFNILELRPLVGVTLFLPVSGHLIE
jgi:hypothetical protein